MAADNTTVESGPCPKNGDRLTVYSGARAWKDCDGNAPPPKKLKDLERDNSPEHRAKVGWPLRFTPAQMSSTMEDTKLIELSDGTLVEVSATPGEVRQISGGLAEKVSSNFDKVQSIITKMCHPILDACREISKETKIERAEVTVGLSFEAEGNIYVTKLKGSANINLKLTIHV